ncbi:hypothetical protein [Rhodococcus sp. DN22]|uniref:hypothetical protein n=1 Tax=Rhodococcus TaxID=1827 RepID=UPI0030D18366
MIEAAVRRLTAIGGYLANPYSASVLVVTMMPVLSVIALGSLVWRPLGYIFALFTPIYVRNLHRWIKSGLQRLGSRTGGGTTRRVLTYAVLVVLAGALSIPVVQVFFRGDLGAMSAPSVVAEMTDKWRDDQTPHAVYGATPTWPSYAPCQFIQSWTGPTAASSCYSTVGYLRLWQMPTAVPMLFSLSMIYVLFPLALARFGHRNK